MRVQRTVGAHFANVGRKTGRKHQAQTRTDLFCNVAMDVEMNVAFDSRMEQGACALEYYGQTSARHKVQHKETKIPNIWNEDHGPQVVVVFRAGARRPRYWHGRLWTGGPGRPSETQHHRSTVLPSGNASDAHVARRCLPWQLGHNRGSSRTLRHPQPVGVH